MQLSKAPKPPRNSPCSCGSGAKYKKCCFKKEQEQMAQQIKVRRLLEDDKKKRSETECKEKKVIQDSVAEIESTEAGSDQQNED